jgi:hypothetical protein
MTLDNMRNLGCAGLPRIASTHPAGIKLFSVLMTIPTKRCVIPGAYEMQQVRR